MAKEATGSWRRDAPATLEEARNRLIDAAEVCFSKFGVAKTTLEDIAGQAGVSRATVYRYFDGGRDEIILGVVLRDVHEFLEALGRRIRREDLTEAIVEAVLYTVSVVRRNDNLALLFAPEVAGQTSTIAGASSTLFRVTSEFLRPILDAAGAERRLRPGVEPEDAAEFVLRVILSLLAVRGPRHRVGEDERRFVRVYCAGAIVEEGRQPSPSPVRTGGAAWS
ncbi:MAG TPA: TetR/AcrR family transcriptional regulator [Acidimicrobiales bacterium]|nr:TetR/AcrR family transcriptional regulator [Acidimicrobiales bacterium]